MGGENWDHARRHSKVTRHETLFVVQYKLPGSSIDSAVTHEVVQRPILNAACAKLLSFFEFFLLDIE